MILPCAKLLILLCITVFGLCGCMERASRSMAMDMVAQAQFREQRFSTRSFVLYGLWRAARAENPTREAHSGNKRQPAVSQAAGSNVSAAQATEHAAVQADRVLHVYVEGDGVAWASSRRPSPDPTPDTPVVLSLAVADPTSGPVLYLARPCQYVRGDDARQCRPEHWTSGRLSETVIASLNEAVDMAKTRSGAQRVVLVGYSGGGGAVALMAAQRDDVDFLGTVAGLLDHAAWTAHHAVSPLRASLNPLDYAVRLRGIPQRHVTGGKDTVVPASVNEAFCRAVHAESTNSSRSTGAASTAATAPQSAHAAPTAQCFTVPGVGHAGPWDKVWEYRY